MRGFAVALVAFAFVLPAFSQSSPTVQVDFSNPALTPAAWTLEIHPDGRGHFRSRHGANSPDVRRTIVPPDIDRDIQLSETFAQHVFLVARRHKLFQIECESHLKVAYQGNKKLSYSGPDGQGSCQFNYSRDNEIQALGDSMIAVASTLVEGARLEKILQHDKLGLDKEMEDVDGEVSEGRMVEIGTIRDILDRVAQCRPG